MNSPAIRIDPRRVLRPVRPLHGVNLGPISEYWFLDHTEQFKLARIPEVRLHDGSRNCLDVADLHCIFPDPAADPADPVKYRFAQTDDYLSAIRNAGAEIYFRFGETIEHQPTKQYIRADIWTPDQLARVCLGIVKHYNAGWADGFSWNIRRWEFWNEPEGAKNWTGTPDQFFDLYRAVALAIKKHDPALQVGLAGFSKPIMAALEVEDAKVPYRRIVKRCAAEGVPTDFVSWHAYYDDWNRLDIPAGNMRHFLDSIGLPKAESHLSEWGYLPRIGDTTLFAARRAKDYPKVAELVALGHSLHGAGLVFGSLIKLQDLPIDRAHHYSADANIYWGMFHPTGLTRPKFHAFAAFAEFLDATERQDRIAVSIADPELQVLACINEPGTGLRIGIANIGKIKRDVSVQIETANPDSWQVARHAALTEHDGIQDVTRGRAHAAGSAVVLPMLDEGLTMLELVKRRPG